MNEIFDQLLVKLIFCLILCAGPILFKIYSSLYLSNFREWWRKKYSLERPTEIFFIFSRILGLTLIYSGMVFFRSTTVSLNIFHFVLWGLILFLIYIASLYIIESIILFNFTAQDELIKRQNMAYATVSAGIALSTALVIKKILHESENSLVIMAILWLGSLVLLGVASKLFAFTSKLKFNKLMIQKSVPLAISHFGFIFSAALMIGTTFTNEHNDVKSYISSTFLKGLLCLIIFPLVFTILKNIFVISSENIQEHGDLNTYLSESLPSLGYGAYEAALFLSSGLLTSVVIDKVKLGIIYPFF